MDRSTPNAVHVGCRVGTVDDFDPQKDEDNGYAKPAGPVVQYIGAAIGLTIGMALVWWIRAHH